MLRATQETWMMKRTWKGFRKMPVERQVALTVEMMRAHRCGPRQEGDVDVLEDDERYTIVMDPCGSGGRMRRGDPMDGTPSRLGPPLQFRRDAGGALVELGPQGRALLLRPLRAERDIADRVGRRAALGHRLRPRPRQALPLALLQEARTDSRGILDPPRQGKARAFSTTRESVPIPSSGREPDIGRSRAAGPDGATAPRAFTRVASRVHARGAHDLAERAPSA